MLQIDHGLHHLFAIQHHHIGSARRIHWRTLQGEGPYRRFIRLMQEISLNRVLGWNSGAALTMVTASLISAAESEFNG